MPQQITFLLSDEAVNAVEAATAAHNRDSGDRLSPQEFFTMQVQHRVDFWVQSYRSLALVSERDAVARFDLADRAIYDALLAKYRKA